MTLKCSVEAENSEHQVIRNRTVVHFCVCGSQSTIDIITHLCE